MHPSLFSCPLHSSMKQITNSVLFPKSPWQFLPQCPTFDTPREMFLQNIDTFFGQLIMNHEDHDHDKTPLYGVDSLALHEDIEILDKYISTYRQMREIWKLWRNWYIQESTQQTNSSTLQFYHKVRSWTQFGSFNNTLDRMFGQHGSFLEWFSKLSMTFSV